VCVCVCVICQSVQCPHDTVVLVTVAVIVNKHILFSLTIIFVIVIVNVSNTTDDSVYVVNK